MRPRIALASLGLLAVSTLGALLVLYLVQPASAAGGAAAVQAGGGHSCALTSGSGVKCWGANGSGQLGNGASEDEPLPADVYTCEDLPETAGGLPCVPLAGVDAVATGFTHTCAVHESGAALCWGRNQYGQLGDATTANRTMAVPVCAEGSVAGGAASCCVGAPSPTPAATATGTVTATPTSTATATSTATPTGTPVPGLCGALAGVAQVGAGFNHTCALTGDGTVWCWGENRFGQLGNGTTLNSSLPVHVCGSAPAGGAGGLSCPPLAGVASIHTGSHHTCALLENDSARCWGSNGSGQLGDSTFDDRLVALPVCALGTSVAGGCANLSGIASLTTGGLHTCAILDADGALLCWGENSSGQLGDGTSFDRAAPTVTCGPEDATAGVSTPGCCVVVPNGSAAGAEPCALRDVASASAGGEHTCAILEAEGALLCWGSNTAGQLGNGAAGIDSSLPVAVCPEAVTAGGDCGAFSNAETVSGGTEHTCARTETGGVFCWGAGSQGQIGDGGTGAADRPVEVTGFQGKPTPTPTRTPTMTLTATSTATRTPIVTPQGTSTETATPTVTAAPGATDTPTRTSTPLPAATSTPTRTATRTPTHTPTTPASMNGDVNCDGQVTAVDAAIILQLVAALIDSVGCPNNVDVNGDGAIDPIDSALVLQYAAGLISSL